MAPFGATAVLVFGVPQSPLATAKKRDWGASADRNDWGSFLANL